MSDKDSVLLSLRFFDINDPTANAPVPSKTDEDYSRNTYFKVRKQSKFGSLVKKFAQINNYNPYDLTFYHLKRFLNPHSTIADLKLKNEDQILVKKLIPLTIQFTKDDALRREQFYILKDSVVVKVEEDCVFLGVYQILATHLQISEKTLAANRLTADRLEYFKVDCSEGQSTTKQVTDIQGKLHKLGITANDTVVIKCNDEQYNFFLERLSELSGGPPTNKQDELQVTITELRKRVQSLSKENSELVVENKRQQILANQNQQMTQNTEKVKDLTSETVELRKELSSVSGNLSKKLVLINTLQNEKKKLADDLGQASDQVELLTKDGNKKDKQIKDLEASLGELNESLFKKDQEAANAAAKNNRNELQFKKRLNDELLAKKDLERQLADNTNLFKNYVANVYNEYGSFLSGVVNKVNILLSRLQQMIQNTKIDRHLSAEINLDPIDFDYLNVIISSSRVAEKFYPTNEDAECNKQRQTRPEPLFKYCSFDNELYTIFKILYEKDSEQNGLTIKEISDYAGSLNTQLVSEKIARYLQDLSQRKESVFYNLEKKWNHAQRLSVYVYDKPVDWNYITADGELVKGSVLFEGIKANDVLSQNAFEYNILKKSKIGDKLRGSCTLLEQLSSQCEVLVIRPTSNVAKNLVNVLRLIKGFKDNEAQFQVEKQQMVGQFKEELKHAADKVSFVYSYGSKLEELTAELNRLKDEKIQFENDNDIYEKFQNYGIQRPLKAIQAASSSSASALENSASPVLKQIANVPELPREDSTLGNIAAAVDSTPAATTAQATRKRLISVGDSFSSINMNGSLAPVTPGAAADVSVPRDGKENGGMANGAEESQGVSTLHNNNQNNTTTMINTDSILTAEEPAAKRQKLEEVNKVPERAAANGYTSTTANPEYEGNNQPEQETAETNGTLPQEPESAEDGQYLNIKIDLANAAPVFFKVKKTTKLKRILKSYKVKLSKNAATKLTKSEVNNVKFNIGGTMDLDYNQPLQELKLRNYSIITAVVTE